MSDPITRLNAALEGRYRIERELGEGGMATVYLARDERHSRNVALKVLKPELAAVVGAERFLAEIETTANLQHPHILPLFDSGEADGFLFYVMPYVEGESLRERLDREHQLPVDEAVQIAKNVAEALDYAHRHGVIHRDIKPANILLQDGKPVVSDFGIALALSSAGGHRLTETGLSLGTPHYMSPEQATGDQHVGPPTDIWALGCVLYEMLVGEPPYTGSTPQAILGRIITGEPEPVTEQRKAAPPNVEAVISKALEKLPADRFTDGAALRTALLDSGFRHRTIAAGDGRDIGRGGSAPSYALMAIATAVVSFVVWGTREDGAPPPVERYRLVFETGQEPDVVSDFTKSFAISEDGALVYRGPSDAGANMLWVRPRDRLSGTAIEGTDDATAPAFSIDGSQLAFTQRGQVKVVPATGGPIRTLGQGRTPTWSPNGDLFGAVESGAVRWPGAVGEPELVTRREERELSNQVWDVLPDGSAALVVVDPFFGDDEIRLLDLESGEATFLAYGRAPVFLAAGYLLFIAQGRLMAAALEPRTGRIGPAVPVVEDRVSQFAVSSTGRLVYTSNPVNGITPVWVDRTGEMSPVDSTWAVDGQFQYSSVSISPAGDRVAISIPRDGPDRADIYIKELDEGPSTPLTTSGLGNRRASWIDGGDRVLYVAYGEGAEALWQRRADGTDEPVLVMQHDLGVSEGEVSSDGLWLAYRVSTNSGGNNPDIYLAKFGTDGAGSPLVASEFDELELDISPYSQSAERGARTAR